MISATTDHAIASHSAQTHEATTVANVEYLREALYPQLDTIEVIGIDEVQFFDAAIIPLALELIALGKRVIMAGLDTTFAGEPFGPVPNLMAIADTVTKLSAVCMVCGAGGDSYPASGAEPGAGCGRCSGAL